MRKKLYLLLCGVTLMITACSFNDSQKEKFFAEKMKRHIYFFCFVMIKRIVENMELNCLT